MGAHCGKGFLGPTPVSHWLQAATSRGPCPPPALGLYGFLLYRGSEPAGREAQGWELGAIKSLCTTMTKTRWDIQMASHHNLLLTATKQEVTLAHGDPRVQESTVGFQYS